MCRVFRDFSVYCLPKICLIVIDLVRLIIGIGIAGGPVLEEVDGNERAFIALVGWESVEVHEAYHRTRHFKEAGRRVLLDEAGGYAYYGHIAFAHSEEKGEGPKL